MKITKVATLVIFLLLMMSCATIQTSQDVIPERGRIFSEPYSKVYSHAVSALMSLKWQISHSDKQEGLIQARTPMTLWTWGDLVTVHIVEQSSGKVKVDVTSGSPQQYDWGKNRKNIEAFYSELQKRVRQ